MFDDAFITGDTTRFKQYTADVNLAKDEFLKLAAQASGTWQFDDSNHTKHPLIYMNLVSGQQDYNFTTDEEGSLILDFYKVGVLSSDTATNYTEIFPVDQQSSGRGAFIFEEESTTGTPTRYDKTGRGVFLNVAPDYNATKGLKIAINRETTYYTTSDTTKTTGVPGVLDSWFYKKPALENAKRLGLKDQIKTLTNDVEMLKQDIIDHFSMREKDKKHVMRPKKIRFV